MYTLYTCPAWSQSKHNSTPLNVTATARLLLHVTLVSLFQPFELHQVSARVIEDNTKKACTTCKSVLLEHVRFNMELTAEAEAEAEAAVAAHCQHHRIAKDKHSNKRTGLRLNVTCFDSEKAVNGELINIINA